MSAVKSGSSLRNLVLTPERIPDFFIPSRSPLQLLSPDRTRLLSGYEDDSPGAGPAETPPSPEGLRLLLPRVRAARRAAAAAESADTDLTTRAAMSLPHVEKVTTPYGFRAVLAASPCTRRRESLFHRTKQVPEPTELQIQDPGREDCVDSTPAPSPGSGRGRSLVCLRPVKALGLYVIRELKRPAAALKARRTET